MPQPDCRPSQPLLLTALAAIGVALTPACQLFIPDNTCPDLDEVCPDVQCEDRGGYVQNRDGCSICECIDDQDPGPGAVCWDDSECGDGQRCDVVNFCEPAPNCDPDDDENICPEACYGRCVEASGVCTSDSDCAPGQLCAFFTNERPADQAPGGEEERPDDGGGSDGAPAPPPDELVANGVCVDVSCGNADVQLPECQPGSELLFDPSIVPCNPICVSVDFCRELLPEECVVFPGCQLVEEPCGGCATEPGPDGEQAPCDCAFIERCVAIDDCASLPLEQCELNPSCVLKAIGGGNGGEGGGGGAEPEPDPGVPCDPDAPDCGGDDPAPPPPPDEQLVCVPRGADGTCLSDADCAAGEICELSTVCGSGCTVDADGNETCFEECWSERGFCVVSDRSCFDLILDECLADPRCELVEQAGAAPCFCDDADPNCACEEVPVSVCQPRVGACLDDGDCFDTQHCEVIKTCPACDPSANDIDCLAPCFVEGRCVEGAPPPVTCAADADCGFGSACVPVTVCATCDGSNGGEGGTDPGEAPPPCDPVCRDENICVQTEPSLCFDDSECNGGFCDLNQIQCLVAPCPGVCVATPQTCEDDGGCGPGQRCALELGLPVCVDDEDATGFCSNDDQCADASGQAGSCRFSSTFCLDDPTTDTLECLGWCANACAEVETPAIDPASGLCEVFPDSCIPPGWEVTNGCAP